LDCLPPREVADALIRRYLDTIEKAHHFFHTPTFEAELQHFWEQPDDAEDSWLSMLFVILSLGCEAHNIISINTADMATNFLDAAQGFLHRTPFMAHPNLDTIRTLCLMVLAKKTWHMSCNVMDASWCLTGIIVRLAISMGLHIEPTCNANSNTLETEMRRILWATVMYLDLHQSVMTGMPQLLRPRDYTTLPPSNINHSNIQHLSYPRPIPLEQVERTESTFHILFANAFPLASEAVELINCPGRSDGYDAAVRITSELHQVLAKAVSLLRKSKPAIRTQRHLDPEDLQAIMIDLLFRRLLISLHRRFTHDPLDSRLYPVSYVTSLDCSLAILVHQNNLGAVPDDHKAESNWFARLFWPEFHTAAFTLGLYLLRGDPLLDASMDSQQYFDNNPRLTVLSTLRSFRDIWRKEAAMNACQSHSFLLIDRVVSTLDETAGRPIVIR
jgi:hypothetical protein